MTYPIRRTGLLNTAIEVSGWPFDNVITVSTTDPDADFATIAEAITAASAGDIILIDPGTYNESLNVNKAVVLKGFDANKTEITTGGSAVTIGFTTSNVVLKNLKIGNTNTGSSDRCVEIFASSNNGIIENCILEISTAGTANKGIQNVGGAGLIVRDTDITISNGTASNRCYDGNTAASDVEFIRSKLEASGTGAAEISLNHASAVATITESILVNGTVTINANLGTFNGTLQDAILVNNGSGAIAVFNDVGYLDEAGEYQTTTTEADNVTWCVVVIGNVDGENIFIKRRGNVIVNYTGATPSAGDFLITSTTAGSVKQQITMRPEIFAVATANGAGGTVAVLLLTGTGYVPITVGANLVSTINSDTTDFVSTINAVPTATTVVYGTVTSGAENTIVPQSGSELANVVLHNTTVGASPPTRLIVSVNTGTNTITTISQTDNWANGDALQARSRTNLSVAGGGYFFDVDLSQVTALPLLSRGLLVLTQHSDSGAGVQNMQIHPFLSFSGGAVRNNRPNATSKFLDLYPSIPLIDKKFTWRCIATGAGTTVGRVVALLGAFVAEP